MTLVKWNVINKILRSSLGNQNLIANIELFSNISGIKPQTEFMVVMIPVTTTETCLCENLSAE